MTETNGTQPDIEFLARNIINQIGDLWSEQIPSPLWVPVRQATNDQLDTWISGLLRDALAATSDTVPREEALRQMREDQERQERAIRIADDLRRERNSLALIIELAPHHEDCNIDQENECEGAHECDCWKSSALTSDSSAETPRPRESLAGVGPGFLMSGKLAELEVADLRSLLVELDIDDDDAKVVVTVAPIDDEPYDQMPRHIASISVAPR